MGTPDVSVITGARDAMPHVIETVESIARQTIGTDRLEFIAVDDASSDGTGPELDRLAEDRPWMRVVHEEEARGTGAVRNTGLDLARGRYVFFLDAGERLCADALERLTALGDTEDADIVAGEPFGTGGTDDSPGTGGSAGAGSGAGPARARGRATGPAVPEEAAGAGRADLFDSRAYWSLGPMKLFRRSLLTEHGLRFPEDMRFGEDHLFTARAYLAAAVIAVPADPSRQPARRGARDADRAVPGAPSHLLLCRRLITLVTGALESGPRRDHLLRRHFQHEVVAALGALALSHDEEERENGFTEVEGWIGDHYSEEIAARAPAEDRLLYHLVQRGMLKEALAFMATHRRNAHGKTVVEDGRVYRPFPLFQDLGAVVPDEVYDVTDELPVVARWEGAQWADGRLLLRGTAYITHVDTLDAATAVVLRERESGAELRFPATAGYRPGLAEAAGHDGYDYDFAGFEAEIDLTAADDGAPLSSGLWDVHLDVGARGVVRRTRFGRDRTEGVEADGRCRLVTAGTGTLAVTPYLAGDDGDLTLHVGDRFDSFTPRLSATEASWRGGRDLALFVSGETRIAAAPADALTLRATGPGGVVHEGPVVLDTATTVRPGAAARTEGGFSACLPVRSFADGAPLPLGEWAVELVVRDGNTTRVFPVPVPSAAPGIHWWQGMRLFRAAGHEYSDGGTLALTVSVTRLGAALRSRLTLPRPTEARRPARAATGD